MGLKLTNSEIDALVSTARKAKDDMVSAHNAALLKDKRAIAEAKKWLKVLSGIPANIRKTLSYQDGKLPSESALIHAVIAPTKKNLSFDNSAFRNKIILTAMECETPAQLKKKLGIKDV